MGIVHKINKWHVIIWETLIFFLPFSHTRDWYAKHYLSDKSLNKSLGEVKKQKAKIPQSTFVVKLSRLERWHLVWRLLNVVVLLIVVVISILMSFYSWSITYEQTKRLLVVILLIALFCALVDMLYVSFGALKFLLLEPTITVYKDGILLKMGNRENFIMWEEMDSIRFDKRSSLLRGGPRSFTPVFSFIKITYKKSGEKRAFFLYSRSENIFLFLLAVYYFSENLKEDIYQMFNFVFEDDESRTRYVLEKVAKLAGIFESLGNYRN